jgi:hypothetical protein
MEPITVRQLAEKQPAFNEQQIRWLLRFREENGLNACVFKIGSRVLIDPEGFDRWLEGNRESR